MKQYYKNLLSEQAIVFSSFASTASLSEFLIVKPDRTVTNFLADPSNVMAKTSLTGGTPLKKKKKT